MMAIVALTRAANRPGGPAACEAPAWSRSDKKQRHPHTNAMLTWTANRHGGIVETAE